MGEFWHLSVNRVADEQRRASAQKHHRNDRPVVSDLLDDAKDVVPGERTFWRCTLSEMSRIRHKKQPDRQWQINGSVREQSQRRAQQEHQSGSNRRAEKDSQLAAGGVEPHGTLNLLGADDVV